jgi:hypothetical protein
MGADQGHRQLVDLGQQGLEALVFLNPRADLVQEVKGDVDSAGPAPLLVGEVPGEVRLALAAAATGLAAAFAHLGQGGGQHGLAGCQAGPPGVQHAADGGRVLGYAHGHSR